MRDRPAIASLADDTASESWRCCCRTRRGHFVGSGRLVAASGAEVDAGSRDVDLQRSEASIEFRIRRVIAQEVIGSQIVRDPLSPLSRSLLLTTANPSVLFARTSRLSSLLRRFA